MESFGCDGSAFLEGRTRPVDDDENGWSPAMGDGICDVFVRYGIPARVRRPKVAGFYDLAYLDFMVHGRVATVGVQRQIPPSRSAHAWEVTAPPSRP